MGPRFLQSIHVLKYVVLFNKSLCGEYLFRFLETMASNMHYYSAPRHPVPKSTSVYNFNEKGSIQLLF